MDFILERLNELIDRFETDSEVAIFPYGKVGHRCFEILKKWGYLKGRTYLVDNNSREGGVIDFTQFLSEADNPFIIIAINSGVFLNEYMPKLFDRGFSARQIGIVCSNSIRSFEALKKVIHCPKHTLLDVGCGSGIHAQIFEDFGKDVTGITMSKQGMYSAQGFKNVLIGDYQDFKFNKKFEIVWMSHVLEHIVDVRKVLEKTRTEVLCDKGTLAITVPSSEKNITLSHVHSFDAGRILRYLLYAGFDCRNAMILAYGFDLSVILPEANSLPEHLVFHECGGGHSPDDDDFGKLKELFDYLPKEIEVRTVWDGNLNFDGNITKLNW